MVVCPVCGGKDFVVWIEGLYCSEDIWSPIKIFNNDSSMSLFLSTQSIFEIDEHLLQTEREDANHAVFDLCLNCGTAFT